MSSNEGDFSYTEDSGLEKPQKKVRESRGILYFMIALITFVIPLFFIPSLTYPIEATKHVLFFLLLLVASIAFVVYSVKEKRFGFIKSPITIFLILLPIVYLVSGLTSLVPSESMMDFINTNTSAIWIVMLALFAYLASDVLGSKDRIHKLLLTILLSSGILSLFYVLKVTLLSEVLSLGVFSNLLAGPFGGWYDLGILSGLTLILTLVLLEGRSSSITLKVFYIIVGLLSILSLILINFSLIWMTLLILSLILFIYLIFIKSRNTNSSNGISVGFPKYTLIGLVIAILFTFLGGVVGDFTSQTFGVQYYEVKPRFAATMEVADSVLDDSPFFGLGPGQFNKAWDLHRSTEVNNSVFWNLEHHSGSGIIPSSLVEVGIVGLSVWLLLTLSILYGIYRYLKDKPKGLSLVEVASISGLVFIGSFFITYNPSPTLYIYLFLFVGILLSQLSRVGIYERKKFQTGLNSSGFVFWVIVIIFVLAAATVSYIYYGQYKSLLSYRQGLVELNLNGNIEEAFNSFNEAKSYYNYDLYNRTLAELSIINLDRFISENQGDIDPEDFQQAVGSAIAYAETAISKDPEGFDNYLMLAAIYEYLSGLGVVDGANQSAAAAYEAARTKNPANPLIDLARARLEATRGNINNARLFLYSSLIKKPNFSQALVLLSRLELQVGDRQAALRTMAQAANSDPGNSAIFLQLGGLLMDEGRFDEAVSVLERSVIMSPYSVEAKYLLAISYLETGRSDDALVQFEDIKTINPDTASSIDPLINSIVSPETDTASQELEVEGADEVQE